MGASRVVEMEIDDLQMLCVGRPESERVDLLIYDPMPGGSGLLDQICDLEIEARLSLGNVFCLHQLSCDILVGGVQAGAFAGASVNAIEAVASNSPTN